MSSIVSRLFGVLVLSLLASTLAHAQPARSFVSSFGTDANPCSIAAPCRTLQRGIDVVASGGDVLIVDTGGFGTNVLISKSVSVIAAPGVQARIALSGIGTGIAVNGAGISVSIHNLGISASASGIGINFMNGTALSLSDVDINGNSVSGTALVFHQAAGGHLTISNTGLRNANQCFITAVPSSEVRAPAISAPSARTTIVNSRAENCAYAFDAGSDSVVSIKSTVAAGDGTTSIYGFSTQVQTNAIMTLDNVVATHAGYGVYAGSVGGLTMSNALLTGNQYAAATGDSGTARTYGNSRTFGNIVSDAFTGFTIGSEQ